MTSRGLASFAVLTVKGFCMGAANVIPGVSGGTMALILGIYVEFIDAIRTLNLKVLRLITVLKMREALGAISWQFLLPVGLGILLATLSLARILSVLLETYPVMVWSFFFGLILSSVLTVSKVVGKWGKPTFAAVVLGAVGAFFLFGLVPTATPNSLWFIFLSGVLAICAMILPGISGAYILVLLGKYHYALEAINNRDLAALFILTAGAVVGLLSFVRVIGWLLKAYHDVTMAILIGLMLGSLRRIWPWKETLSSVSDSYGREVAALQVNILPGSFNEEVVCALLCMLLGVLVILFMNVAARDKG
jgi:putative membrane protein